MKATYILNLDELNVDFLEGLKLIFNGAQLRIKVEKHDETEYLMSSPKNHEMLMDSIRNVEKGINLVEIPIKEIEKAALENTNSESD